MKRNRFLLKMIRHITTILLAISISSCCSYDSKDFNFNENDLNHFSSFNQGDTIYYESSSHNIDTILILGFGTEQQKSCGGFLAPSPVNGKWIEIKHLPIDKWHGTTQDGINPIRIDYQKLFWISKHPAEKKTTYDISFKDFYTSFDTIIGEFHTEAIILNSRKISNYYLVQHGYPERVIDSSNIELVYWTDKDGLVAYKNKGGEIWTKK